MSDVLPDEFTNYENARIGGDRLRGAVECLLFAAGEPISGAELARRLEVPTDDVESAIRDLRYRYEESGLQVVEIAGGYQMATRAEHHDVVARLLAPHAHRLSRPALETVSIVAYRQPCTQSEIEAIRGVASDAVLKTLLDRDLISEAGRKSTPGRPILYATTPLFMHYFGLADMRELPPIDEDEIDTAVSMQSDDARAQRTVLEAAGIES